MCGLEALGTLAAVVAPFERLVQDVTIEALASDMFDRNTVREAQLKKGVRESVARVLTLRYNCTNDTAEAREAQHEMCDFRSNGHCLLPVQVLTVVSAWKERARPLTGGTALDAGWISGRSNEDIDPSPWTLSDPLVNILTSMLGPESPSRSPLLRPRRRNVNTHLQLCARKRPHIPGPAPHTPPIPLLSSELSGRARVDAIASESSGRGVGVAGAVASESSGHGTNVFLGR